MEAPNKGQWQMHFFFDGKLKFLVVNIVFVEVTVEVFLYIPTRTCEYGGPCQSSHLGPNMITHL